MAFAYARKGRYQRRERENGGAGERASAEAFAGRAEKMGQGAATGSPREESGTRVEDIGLGERGKERGEGPIWPRGEERRVLAFSICKLHFSKSKSNYF